MAQQSRPKISEAQKQNIKKLITDLQTSVDQTPSEESIGQLKADFKTAISDRKITQAEFKTLATDTLNIIESAGVTPDEARTVLYDLQNIAQASRLPRTDDTVTGTSQNDILWGGLGQDTLNGAGSDDAGLGEIDYLCGGGGQDTFILGDATQSFYNDGTAGTLGLTDYAVVLDFNLQQDKIQLFGSDSDYLLAALPSELAVSGTGIYYTAGSQSVGARELVGVVLGANLSDFSSGFSFVQPATQPVT
jgi:Ca2+-binding RTX toxin-like protein